MSETTAQAPATALAAPKDISRKKIVSWAMWDWGTQPFNTVITTFVFSVYITGSAFGDTNATSQALSLSTTLAGLFVALAAPVLGQTADRSGRTVTVLRSLTWTLALISAALFFVRPEPAFLWLGLGLLAVGSVVSEIAGVNYNSLLDEVAGERNVGRVSGFGWGMGYLGGIVVLLVLYFLFIQPEVGLFGVTGADGMDIRVSMVVCGVWTLLFTIPTFLALHDRPATTRRPIPGIDRWNTRQPAVIWRWLAPVVASYAELWNTVRRLWDVSRHTVFFLLASALFRDGLAGVFAFGAVIAAGTFGFSSGEVVIFGAAANIVAGLSTIALGLLDDKLGPKRVIMISLIALVASGIVIFAFHDGGATVFWVAGLIMCMFVGPAQSASRSFLARLVPAGRTGEVFGLYATTGRVVSFLSPLLFGAAITVGAAVTGGQNTQYWGILGIVLVLLAGLIVMIPVKEHTEHHAIS
ncbi:MFS transporter [Brooklawnia cerclae]|uniref:UMF1 family MFS transporter n=2 Tax=Brooklawnia cerclae TaxID=349934 RepID=A0ABX0SG42_9ACTN|nr:UMF1 family MFS transporter [Brooklawnia cerclae]